MSPRSVRITLALSLSALFAVAWRLAPPEPLAQDLAQVEIVDTPVAGSVHMLAGQGGNMGVSAGADGLLLIDDEFAPLAPKIRAALDALDGAGDGAPRWVLNTHFHGDHTGSNPVFGRLAPIVAQENVRKRLVAGDRADKPMVPEGLPVLTYEDGITLHFNGERIDVRHYPACHTDGDSVITFTGSNVVHMGDLYFNGMFPFVDIDSGGSVAGLTKAVGRILEQLGPDTKLIPGHGAIGTRVDLQRYLAMLEKSQSLVAEALKAGDDVDAMLANGLLDEFKDWSWSFVDTKRWLETLVREAEAR